MRGDDQKEEGDGAGRGVDVDAEGSAVVPAWSIARDI